MPTTSREKFELLFSMLIISYYDFPLSVCQTRCCWLLFLAVNFSDTALPTLKPSFPVFFYDAER